jgi:hypothetical protein
MKFRLLTTILAMLASTSGTRAQVKYPQETRNAALRYWTAFAEMQDPPSDKATQELLEKTVAGETAWSETTLGAVLDANADAIQTMQRATKPSECDWGLEYRRGPRVQVTQSADGNAVGLPHLQPAALDPIEQATHNNSGHLRE